MASNFRETAAGQLIRLVSRNRLLRYPEEKADFQLPQCWIDLMNGGDPLAEVVQHPDTGVVSRVEVGGGPPDGETATVSSSSNDAASPETPGDGEARKHLPEETNGSQTRQAPSSKSDEVEVETKGKKEKEGPVMEERRPSSAASKGRTNSIATAYEQRRGSLGLRTTKSRADTLAYTEARLEADEEQRLNRRQTLPIVPRRNDDGAILVDWYYTDDPENPQNWSNVRRAGVTFIICLYTFVVYSSSAIYTTSELGIMEEFGVSQTRASLGLSIFVLGYGVGPLLFSPLSEMARIGRNLVYIASMFLFVVISIPAALPHDYAGLMVLRFLQGFFGSPCLAAGGATVGDMYSLMYLPYALIAWVSAAYCGPSLGPLLSGYSVPAEGWRWSLLEILWASAPVFVAMFFLLPETSQPYILRHRARRLRKLTGDARFMSQSEIDEQNARPSAVLLNALIKPLEITIKDPAILFVQVYTAIIYGIYYSFFEVFPLVYPVYYNMSAGQIGLVFLCILVSCVIGIAVYISYLSLYMTPRVKRIGFTDPQEIRLVPALFAAFGPTIGLFIFAWTARPDFPWIAPTIGITIYGATVFIVMQSIFVYIPLSYAQYAASLFAANDFFRSALACGSVLVAKPLFGSLGVARGTSLLGGLSTVGIVGIWLLYAYGGRLRAMSKFAMS